jgi:hypothetical protein
MLTVPRLQGVFDFAGDDPSMALTEGQGATSAKGPPIAEQQTVERHGSVKIETAGRGVVRLEPRVRLPALITRGDRVLALAAVTAESLMANVSVIAGSLENSGPLHHTVDESWPVKTSSPQEGQIVVPLLISARSGWFLSGNEMLIFDRAILLEGAQHLERALQTDGHMELPIAVFFDITKAEELELCLSNANQESQLSASTGREGATQKLVIRDQWTCFRIESEPFVMPTTRGYSTAIHVRRSDNHNRQHLVIKPSALGKPLEALRRETGSLIGARVSVRKSPGGPYEVKNETG